MRVIVAARLSVLADGQTGLDSQEKEAVAWAERSGHDVVAVVTDGASGAKPILKRRNLKPWMTDADKLTEYDCIVVLKFDRLTRGDSRETRAIETWADDHGKTLMTTEGLTFPCEGADGIRWDLAKRLAHDEWLRIQERYLRMQRTLKAKGSLVGKAPWGYEIAPGVNEHGQSVKTLVPTPEGRKAIPVIFQKVIKGESLRVIAAWLDGQGYGPAGERGATNWSEARLSPFTE